MTGQMSLLDYINESKCDDIDIGSIFWNSAPPSIRGHILAGCGDSLSFMRSRYGMSGRSVAEGGLLMFDPSGVTYRNGTDRHYSWKQYASIMSEMAEKKKGWRGK